MNPIDLIISGLETERDVIDKAISALRGLTSRGKKPLKTRKLSAAGRARIAAAQRKRWARFRRGKKG